MTFCISRRSFLQGLSALVVGFRFDGALATELLTPDRSVEQMQKSLDVRQLDAWLAIRQDGQVIVYSGKVELGTGVETALRQIVAEELCVLFESTVLIQGDTQLTPDQGITAGSKTIQVGGAQLRRAAASARQYLLDEGARRMGLDKSMLDTIEGCVIYRGDPSGRYVRYTDLLTGGAFDSPVGESFSIRESKNYRIVGQSVPRVDIPAKVFGQFRYVHDLSVPGMVHGRVIRPPITGASRLDGLKIENLDASELPAGARLIYEGNFVGVVAEQEWVAMQAARALKVTWSYTSTLPNPGDLYDRLRHVAGKPEVLIEYGDVSEHMGQAAHVISAEYRWPFQNHDSIGPSCAIADVRADSATIWSGTQGVYPLRSALADLLRLDREAVHVIYSQASGCYGHNGADDAAGDAALLSKYCGRPVRVQWSRADEHGWNPKGPAMLMQLQGGMNASGDLIAWHFQNWTPTHVTRPNAKAGAASLLAGQLSQGLVVQGPNAGGDRNAVVNYTLVNCRVETHWIDPLDSPLRPSALRGLGAVANTFANESFMDELAWAASVDPLAFRLRYLQDPRGRVVLETVVQQARWTPRSMSRRRWTGELAQGRGVSYVQYENENAYVAVVADVAVSLAGVRINRITVAHDCGLIVNPDGVRNQIEGNVIQATARTLKQEVTFNPTGVTSLEWGAYPVLAFHELPEIDIVLIDQPDQPSVGAGEATSAAVPAAIANAVFDATGLRLRQVPLTRERLTEAMQT
ncbi:aldehyde dehydrogenase [Pseudomonas asuensis]|uniref:Aldehyde dehydrogenase n=1 Tax=Pseudomonas asuensis TaxID=1825787 RepID=A0ABQ2H1U8_9PSED|nr:molybdopterin cofactor-binding domain-containing protein [Pseudomonas asuensis]GGM22708.1 aldehyde dehydrogenase [Pseudomonas asuensis]